LQTNNILINIYQVVDKKLSEFKISVTVCPRNSDPFYVVTNYIKKSLLLGHIVHDRLSWNCPGVE